MDFRNSCLALALLLAAIILAQPSQAIGLSSEPLPDYIIAEPRKTVSFEFVANGFGNDVMPYVEGELKDYVTLSEAELVGRSKKKFTATLRFPANITAEPGMHKIMVGAAEVVERESGGINVRTRVQSPLNVFILYPGKYITASLKTQNVDTNETADFKLTISNLGKQDIRLINAVLNIYDSNKTLVKKAESGYFPLASGQKRTKNIGVDTAGLAAGEYNVTAVINYDSSRMSINKSFRIGQMKVNAINYTRSIYSGRINKFNVEVENEWNNEVNAFAVVTVSAEPHNITAKTATEPIPPLSRNTLTGHLDANNTVPGEYPVMIEVHYGKNKAVHRGNITVLKPGILEAPKSLVITGGLAVVALIILLTIINVMLLLKRKKRD